MATEDRTEAAGRHPRNYLGHPCQIEPLLQDAAIERDRLRKMRSDDPRALAQRFAEQIVELERRLNHAHNVIGQTRAMAFELDDGDKLESVLAALEEFALSTSNLMWDTKFRALVVMERGDLVEPSRQRAEVAHG